MQRRTPDRVALCQDWKCGNDGLSLQRHRDGETDSERDSERPAGSLPFRQHPHCKSFRTAACVLDRDKTRRAAALLSSSTLSCIHCPIESALQAAM